MKTPVIIMYHSAAMWEETRWGWGGNDSGKSRQHKMAATHTHREMTACITDLESGASMSDGRLDVWRNT